MGRRNVFAFEKWLQTNIGCLGRGLTGGLHGCMVTAFLGRFSANCFPALYQIPSFSFFFFPFHYSLSCVFFYFLARAISSRC